jgi:hypothetical protein
MGGSTLRRTDLIFRFDVSRGGGYLLSRQANARRGADVARVVTADAFWLRSLDPIDAPGATAWNDPWRGRAAIGEARVLPQLDSNVARTIFGAQ